MRFGKKSAGGKACTGIRMNDNNNRREPTYTNNNGHLLRPLTSIRLDGNGYTDILIVINPAVPENEDIINQTKRRDMGYISRRMLRMEPPGRRKRGRPKRRFMDVVREDMQVVGVKEADVEYREGMITHGSEYLFQALDNKVFIKEVKILVPPNWTKGKYEKAKTETFNKGRIRIDNPHPAFGDDPYTHQTKGCGNEGEYIHFTPNFLLNNNLLKGYGPRVLPEYFLALSERSCLFFGLYGQGSYVEHLIVAGLWCTDKISGQWYEIVNQRPRPCEFDSDGLPTSNCEFLPDAMQSANASIMYMPSIDSTGEWKYSFFNKGAIVQQISLLVISRAAHKDVHPVTVTARMNQQTSDGTKPMVVLAEVSQNYNPVLGASVWANLESDTGHSERLQLIDNGAGTGITENSIIFSSYFFYNILDNVFCICLLFMKYSTNTALTSFSGKVELNPPKPPVNVQPVDVGNFTRTVTGESFVVDRDAPPNFPPNKITDLRAEIQEDTVLLNWTAPGEDFDQGTGAIRLPPHRPWDCCIDLLPGAKLPKGRVYPLSAPEHRAMEEYVQQALRQGFIAPSTSPAASSFFFMGKKDGGLCPCIDYRQLNSQIAPLSYPLRLVLAALEDLREARVFTKLDVRSAYNLVRIRKGDEWKTAFITPSGHYEYRVMPYGLFISPAVFQGFMNEVLRPYLQRFVVGSQRLSRRERNSCLVTGKCLYCGKPGHSISKCPTRPVRTAASTVKFPLDISPLSKLTVTLLTPALSISVRALVDSGSAGNFISHACSSAESHPCGDPRGVSGVQRMCSHAFITPSGHYEYRVMPYHTHVRQVLGALRSHHLYLNLSKCELNRPQTHFLGYVISARGVQMDEGKVKEVRDWPIPETIKELQRFLGFTNFYHRFIQGYSRIAAHLTSLLRGKARTLKWTQEAQEAFHELRRRFCNAPVLRHTDPRRPFVVEVDASSTGIGVALSQWSGSPPLLPPCAFYSHKLSAAEQNYNIGNRELLEIKLALEFRFQVTYRDGSQNGKADALSHVFGPEEPCDPDPILPPSLIIGPIVWEIDEEIRTASSQEPAPEGCPEGRVFVPTTCHRGLIQSVHEGLGTDHPGEKHMVQLVQTRYWWPGMTRDINHCVQECATCAMAKVPHHLPVGKLVPLPIPQRPWSHTSIDFVTDLPRSEGNTCILVVVDCFSKGCHFIPLKGLPTALETAEALFHQVFRTFGLPEEIVLDRGPQFIFQVGRAFFRLLGVSVNLSSGYHPQSNGQAERKIQELSQYLRVYCSQDKGNWCRFLPWAKYAQNSLHQDTTGLTPFQCTLGFQPPLFSWSDKPSNVPAVDAWFQEINRVWESAHNQLRRAVRNTRRHADARRLESTQFHPGDRVWLSTRDLRLKLPCRKLSPRFIGPFKVVRQINDVSYRLKLPPRYRIHPTFHVSRLKPYVSPASRPPGDPGAPVQPEVVDQPEVYGVQEVLHSRRHGGRLEYLVERSWVAYLDPALLVEFHAAHPRRPVPMARGRPRCRTEASDRGLGAVLSQGVEGEERPVLFISCKLSVRESRYSTIERECLTIKWAVLTLQYYPLGLLGVSVDHLVVFNASAI
ncbi:hypothetical protein C0J50_15047 [Silurus asotus]|uniref:Gypsy retrotransposon integrase-like protein 1 n=1 Tax=Silurus asotus TaxID=30991 RepID=A0AAD5AZ74_SILAS|nr:hypothetical protein C0J50_15047 [Silurus asotus]